MGPDVTRNELTIRLDEQLWNRLHDETHRRNISKNKAVSQALRLWLSKLPVQGDSTVDAELAAPVNEVANRLLAVEEALKRVEGNERRILELAQARVVEVANQNEQELVKRIVQMLQVGDFVRRLKDLLLDVEKSRGKHVVNREAV